MQLTRPLNVKRPRFGVARVVLTLLASALLLQTELLQAASNTLDRVRQTATLKVGYYADARPLSYQDESGKPAGYAVAVCQEVANDLKTVIGNPALTVDFVVVNAS